MIIFKLFLVLVTNGQYSLLNIGDHFYPSVIECMEVGRKIAASYPKSQVQYFCEPRTPSMIEDEAKSPEAPERRSNGREIQEHQIVLPSLELNS